MGPSDALDSGGVMGQGAKSGRVHVRAEGEGQGRDGAGGPQAQLTHHGLQGQIEIIICEVLLDNITKLLALLGHFS